MSIDRPHMTCNPIVALLYYLIQDHLRFSELETLLTVYGLNNGPGDTFLLHNAQQGAYCAEVYQRMMGQDPEAWTVGAHPHDTYADRLAFAMGTKKTEQA